MNCLGMTALISLLGCGMVAAAESRTVAANGQSGYVIYHDEQAPSSVKDAAKELQRVLAISTGATLPIVQTPRPPMIVLGDTPLTRQAGIDPARLPEEGFRIQTQAGNIFIVGRDTRDDERMADGGCSDGTFYGAMEFLERFAGVRWLMPGEWGEDVPLHQTLAISDIALSDAPDFQSRSLHMSWGRQFSDSWKRRVRIDVGRQPIPLDYNHAWHRYGMPEKLKGHPEYMALIKGRRVPVEESKFPQFFSETKFCTTNEALLDLYANAVLEDMEKNPGKRMWSIAPSDGGGWCECERCTALDEDCDWPGNVGAKSLTPRLITFYNEIARRVKARQPDNLLGGFAYAAYTYPPRNSMPLESNLFVMLAARPYYGFSLYHPDLSQEFVRLAEAWDSQLHGRMGWFDFSTSVGLGKYSVGAPYPPATPILKLIFPEVKKLGWKAVFWGSSYVQGYGSLNTYLVAKLMWHADADVDALTAEWLSRAYGPGGEPMGRLYALLDKKLAEYKQSRKYDFQYRCVPEQVKAIHLPIFPQMEVLYREAQEKVETDAQRRRLEMFGDNLILLHWNMRKAGWLEKPEQSIFYRSDTDFKTFAEKNCTNPSISLSASEKPEKYLTPQLGVAETKPASVHE